MTTENKTLADVQPGGRVRLGEQAAPPAQAVDLGQFRDLIGFAALAAINLPESDPRRDFIRQSGELIRIIDSAKEISK